MSNNGELVNSGKYGRRDFEVTIIVRAHGNPELTRKCLDSIGKNTDQSSYSLVLVDQEGLLQNPNYVDIHLVTRENMGAVRATNLGLQVAMLDPSEFILVLDNDTAVPDGDTEWLNRFVAHFSDLGVGAVGATSDYVTGEQNIAETPRTYTKEVDESNEGGPGITGPLEAAFLISFAAMYRKSALRSVVPSWFTGHDITNMAEGRVRFNAEDAQGAYLWDEENFEPGCSEDLDISLRLRLSGKKLLIARDVYLHHVGSQAFKDIGFHGLLTEKSRKLVEKWGSDLLVDKGLARKA